MLLCEADLNELARDSSDSMAESLSFDHQLQRPGASAQKGSRRRPDNQLKIRKEDYIRVTCIMKNTGDEYDQLR